MKTWRVIDLIQWTTEYFERHNIPNPRLDVELLLGHVLQKSRLQIYLSFDMPVFQEHLLVFRNLIKKRSAHTPVSYLTNHREFMSLDFYVDSRVLIPRPDTEILIEMVLEQQERPCRLLDIGTGCGAIAISLAVNLLDWEIVATDISAEALDVARQNADKHNCADRITFLQGDLFEAVKELENTRFDWIVSNPPYVSIKDRSVLAPDVHNYEPEVALFAGVDGLNIIRRIIAEAPEFLNPKGKLVLEIGYNQSRDVQELIESSAMYSDCQFIQDYSGIERVVVAST